MTEAARLSIVLLTEDSGKDGRATVEVLAKEMFGLIVPGYGSHRVAFVPRDAREEEAMRGNIWKTDGKNPQEYERRVRLRRYIARQLCLPDVFVLFHIDGDRAWDERHTSENVAKFERLIRNTCRKWSIAVAPTTPGRDHAQRQLPIRCRIWNV